MASENPPPFSTAVNFEAITKLPLALSFFFFFFEDGEARFSTRVCPGDKKNLFRAVRCAPLRSAGDVGTWLRDQIMDHFKEKSKPLTPAAPGPQGPRAPYPAGPSWSGVLVLSI